MAYEGRIVEIPAAAAGLTSHKNPTRVSARELILAESVNFEDGILQREPGAAAVDSTGISGSPQLLATLGVSTKYVGELRTYDGGAAPTWTQTIDTEVGSTARTTFNFVSAGGTTSGNDIVLSIGGKNIPECTAVDSASNTYVAGTMRTESLASGVTTALATLSLATSHALNVVAFELRNTAVAASPATFIDEVAWNSAAGFADLSTGTAINAGSTILVFVMQEKITTLGTLTVDVEGESLTEISAQTSVSGGYRVHVFSKSNCSAHSSSDNWTVNSTTTVNGIAVLVQIDTAYIVAAPGEQDGSAAFSAQLPIGYATSPAFPDISEPSLEMAFIGVNRKQADTTITNATGWTTLRSTNNATDDFQTRVVYRPKYYVGLQHLHALATTGLGAGGTITVTAPSSCFIYGAATELQDIGTGLDRTAFGDNGSANTTAVSIGPTAPLSEVPQVAIASVLVNEQESDCTFVATAPFTERVTVTDGTNGTQVVVCTRDVTSIPTIIGLFDWHPTSAIQRIITVAQDGEIYKEVSGDLDSVNLGVNWSTTGEHRPRFVPAGWKGGGSSARELFIFNGQDAVVYLSADSATVTAATAAADWSGTSASALTAQFQPLNGIFHQNRVWAFGNKNFPHHVYASAPADHSSWTGTDSLDMPIESSIGERLFCAATYQGILLFWKYPRGIFWLDDTDPDYILWKIRPKSHGLGCAPSTYAVLPLDDDVMFMSADGGFHLLSAVDALSGTRVSALSSKMRIDEWLRSNLNLARLSQTVSAWYAHKQIAIWGVPSTNSVTNDLMLYFDFSEVREGGVPKFAYSYRDAVGALAMRTGTDLIERPIMGEAGKVYTLDQATKTKDGVGDTFTAQTPHMDLRETDPDLAARRKQFDWLEYVFDDDSTGDLTVAVYVDKVLVTTLTFDAETERQKQKIAAQGYTISLVESNTAATDDPRIITRYLGITKGDDDPRT